MSEPVTRSAHAKINLGLSIIRKRPDGFHDLETIFCPIALADELTFEPHDEVLLSVMGGSVPADSSNLCIRAAQALKTSGNSSAGIRMTLRKCIPVGAGLGGGSADAACVLRTLNVQWGLMLPVERLHEIAASLGSDVPYFLLGGLAYGSGKGEQLDRLSERLPYWIVTVIPEIKVSTAWAYGSLKSGGDRKSVGLKRLFLENMKSLTALESVLHNDFETAVIPRYPAVGDLIHRLKDLGLSCVHMSGSGSAVFGLTDDRERAFHALQQFSSPYTVSITPPAHP